MISVKVGRYDCEEITSSTDSRMSLGENFFKLTAHNFLPSFSLSSLPNTL